MLNFKKEIIYPLLLAVLILIVSMSWLFLAAYNLLESEISKSKIDDVRFQLISLQRAIVDAETGQRGYLITNNVTFLQAYADAPEVTADIFRKLESAAKLVPDLVPLIAKVQKLTLKKFRIIDASIQVQLNAGAYASHLTLSKDQGKQVMDEIHHDLDIMDNMLLERKEQIEQQVQKRLKQSIFGSILLVITIAGVLVFSYKRTVYLFEQAIENRIQAEKLSFEADHDPLTQLSNRRGLDTYLRKIHKLSKRMNDLYAILYLDLDGFKGVNDKLGHEAGDIILVQTVERFQQALRDTDFLARVGGDEMILVVHRYRDDSELQVLAQRLLDSLKAPFFVEFQNCYLGVSIGIAKYPLNGRHVDQVLLAADKAMYQAKKLGKNRYHFAEMQQHAA